MKWIDRIIWGMAILVTKLLLWPLFKVFEGVAVLVNRALDEHPIKNNQERTDEKV